MTNIAQFLAARLDEDEAAAKAVGANVFRDTWHAVEWYNGQFENGKTALVDVHGLAGAPITSQGALQRVDGEHIARHDPARVLAEVAAKRALLKRLEGDVDGCTDDAEWRGASMALDRVQEYLAAPYAEHPDYDPAWRVPTTEENRP